MKPLAHELTRRLSVMWRQAWPAILEQLLGSMVSYVDTAMVGTLGTAATAAVSINTAPILLLGGVLSGVGAGYSIQAANAAGAQDERKARRVILQSLLAVLTVGFLLLAVLLLLGDCIPVWLGAQPDVLPGAAGYLRLYALGMPCNAALFILSPLFRSLGDARTPLVLNGLSNVTNIALNFFLIYPTRPVTALGRTVTLPGAGMGVAGAAAASSIAITLAGLIMTAAIFRRRQLFSRNSGDSLRPDRTIIRSAAVLGLPYAAERVSVNLGLIVMTRIVASLGTAALSAHHIASTIENLCYLSAFGISLAATTLVGQAVGAQNKEDARAYGDLAGALGFLLCLAICAVLFAVPRPLAGLFTTDEEVLGSTARILRIIAFCEPFSALSLVLSGALRGANDTRYPMLICLGSVWAVRIVLALLFVFVFRWGLAGVWAAMSLELFLRGVLCTLRWRSGKWQRLAGFDP